MGRHDQSQSKKSSATTFFIIAATFALFLGVIGNFYVSKFLHRSDTEENQPEKSTTKIADNHELSPATTLSPEARSVSVLPNPNNQLKDIKTLEIPSPLPELLNSDQSIRNVIAAFSPELAQWLTADQLIRRFVVIANDFSQGTRISNHLSFLRLDQPFTVIQIENASVIDQRSYSRYDKLAQAIQTIDAKTAIGIYNGFKPLMLQVFAEFNYPPTITFDSIVKKAVAEILATPIIEEPIALVRPSTFYKFANPDIENLSPVQKQILRMGPQNIRIVQAKLRELMVELAKSTPQETTTQHR